MLVTAGFTAHRLPRQRLAAQTVPNRPPVVVTAERRAAIYNPQTLPVMEAALARDYRIVFAVPSSKGRIFVYLRRDRRYVRP